LLRSFALRTLHVLPRSTAFRSVCCVAFTVRYALLPAHVDFLGFTRCRCLVCVRLGRSIAIRRARCARVSAIRLTFTISVPSRFCLPLRCAAVYPPFRCPTVLRHPRCCAVTGAVAIAVDRCVPLRCVTVLPRGYTFGADRLLPLPGALLRVTFVLPLPFVPGFPFIACRTFAFAHVTHRALCLPRCRSATPCRYVYDLPRYVCYLPFALLRSRYVCRGRVLPGCVLPHPHATLNSCGCVTVPFVYAFSLGTLRSFVAYTCIPRFVLRTVPVAIYLFTIACRFVTHCCRSSLYVVCCCHTVTTALRSAFALRDPRIHVASLLCTLRLLRIVALRCGDVTHP